jgi:hypothetical protein
MLRLLLAIALAVAAAGAGAQSRSGIVTPAVPYIAIPAGASSGALAAAATRLATTGGRIRLMPGTHTYSSQVTIACPSFARLEIDGYGATITTSGAISALRFTGGSTTGGCTLRGAHINQRNDSSAVAGVELVGAAHAHIVDVAVEANNTSASYAAALVRNSDPANNDTGSFWNIFDGFLVREHTGSDTGEIAHGIILRGAANATTITRSKFNGTITTAIKIEPESGQTYTANGVVIDANAFEGFTTAILVAGAAASDTSGLRITNNRAESGTTFLSLTGQTGQPAVPTYTGGNYFISSVSTYLNNPNNLYVNTFDWSVTPALNRGPRVIGPAGLTVQSTNAANDVATLQLANTGQGLRFNWNDGSLLGWIRYSASGVLEFAGNSGDGIKAYVTSAGGISGTSTTAKNLRGSCTFAGASCTVTFGVAEANATYYVALGCTADETFRWSAKGTGGFTITSSNGSSTATCDWILVR